MRLLFYAPVTYPHFCAGFVEPTAKLWEKALMIAVMLIAVPLVAWWVGAWVVGVVEGRL